MKKLFTLFAFLALFMGAKAANWVEVYSIDYSTKSAFPFYVMGYVPEWVGGVMTDYGAEYRYATQADLDGDGDAKWKDGESSVGTVTNEGGTEYQKVTGAGPYWHQYIVANEVPMEMDGTYQIKVLVKSSAAVNANLQFGNWGSLKETQVAIPASDDFTEVTWDVTGTTFAGKGFICIQPGTSTAVIEWKSLTVYQDQTDVKPVTWQEWLTNDGQARVIESTFDKVAGYMGNANTSWGDLAETKFNDQEHNYLICAWGKEKGVNMNDDGGSDPFPARIEADPDDANNKVFVVHGQPATTEGDASAWDNQFWIQSPKSWKEGEQIKIHFRYKASKEVKVATQSHHQNPSDYLIWHAIGDISFTQAWQDFDDVVTVANDMDGIWSVAFQLNQNDKEAIDFYFDDLSWESMVLEEGYFVAGSNTKTGLAYDFDNAVKFEEVAGNDDYNYVATIGGASADEWVNEIMISTVYGNAAAFKANTLKPTGTIKDDPNEWLDYDPKGSSMAKLKLPAAGQWKIYLDDKLYSMAFEKLAGEDPAEPVDIVTNNTEITVNGQEREDLIDDKNAQSGEITVREEADDPAGESVGGAGHNGQTWDNQFFIKSNRALEKGEVTILKFKYKASVAEAKTTTQCHGENPGAYMHYVAIGDVTFTDQWQDFEKEFTVPNEADGMWNIAFNMAEIKGACVYEIKEVQWYLKDDYNAEGKTMENLIEATGDSNFFVKEGAGTSPYQPSGIFDVINDATTRTNVIYNLSGQRVTKDYKGIVIINGRKVVNK